MSTLENEFVLERDSRAVLIFYVPMEDQQDSFCLHYVTCTVVHKTFFLNFYPVSSWSDICDSREERGTRNRRRLLLLKLWLRHLLRYQNFSGRSLLLRRSIDQAQCMLARHTQPSRRNDRTCQCRLRGLKIRTWFHLWLCSGRNVFSYYGSREVSNFFSLRKMFYGLNTVSSTTYTRLIDTKIEVHCIVIHHIIARQLFSTIF